MEQESPGGSASSVSTNSDVTKKAPIASACIACKLRKVKCDRMRPSCGWCTKSGQPCEYRRRQRPGVKSGFHKELMQRLDRFEDVIKMQSQIIQTYVAQGTTDSETHSVNPKTPSSMLAAEARSSPRAYGAAAAAAVATAATEASPFGREFSANKRKRPIVTDAEIELPSYEMFYHLVEVYFQRVNVWCPVLHWQTTFESFFGSVPADEEDVILLYAIAATALRFVGEETIDAEAWARYHEFFRNKVILYGVDHSTVKSLQAQVILSLDVLGSSNGPPGWNLLAMISRSAVQLGLATEPGISTAASAMPSISTIGAVILPEPKTWIEEEGLRRLFWAVYSLDRFSTIATSFDFAVNDSIIDRRLPCDDKFFWENEQVETQKFHSIKKGFEGVGTPLKNVGWYGLHIEVLDILSQVHLFLRRPVDIRAKSEVKNWKSTYRAFDSCIRSWLTKIPSEFSLDKILHEQLDKASMNSICGWLMLHATYQTAIIRLHSSAAYPTAGSSIFNPSYGARQRCLEAVDKILALGRFAFDNDMLERLGLSFIFSLWVSARLLLVHGSTVDRTINAHIAVFVHILGQMGKYWQVAQRYSTILSRVIEEYEEFQKAGDSDSERSTPSTIKILADMRRCAFDLDVLISRQPYMPRSLDGTAVNASSARTPALNQLECLDIFGFFNVPRVQTLPNDVNSSMSINCLVEQGDSQITDGTSNGSASNVIDFNITENYVPTLETDWLFAPGT